MPRTGVATNARSTREVKMRAVRRFFEEGDKVKLTQRFRGREMAHLELGMQLLNEVCAEVAPIAKVEADPKLNGRQMMMVLALRRPRFLISVARNDWGDDVEGLVNSGDAGALARYQAVRRAILAIIIVLAFTTLVFGGSLHDELTHEYIETLGLALVMVGIGGRLWATLYIGGRKSAVVVSTGPYSITRNPLYLFSSIAAAGVGAQTGSYVVTCLSLVLCAAFFHLVAQREERFLSATLGDEYLSYLRRVPRFLPNPLIYRDDSEVTFQTDRVRTTFVDGLVFLAAIAALEAIEVAQEAGTVPILFWLF